jgi:hypothetical protein
MNEGLYVEEKRSREGRETVCSVAKGSQQPVSFHRIRPTEATQPSKDTIESNRVHSLQGRGASEQGRRRRGIGIASGRPPMDMDPPTNNPSPPGPPDSPPPEKRLASLSLRTSHLPPDFEIHDDYDDDDDEGYLTAVSRVGSISTSASAWKDDLEDADVAPPSPSSSGYAAERGTSLASSAAANDDPQPQPDDDDWPRDKKHLHEVFHIICLLPPISMDHHSALTTSSNLD